MKRIASATFFGSVVVACFFAAPLAFGQKASLISQPRTGGYNRSREVSFQGTVISFDTQSTSAPFGPHALVQTSSGIVDVHLGDARLLASSGLDLKPGDSVRIVASPAGGRLLARIVQKGSLTIAVRSARGVVLRPGRAGAAQDAAKAHEKGVL